MNRLRNPVAFRICLLALTWSVAGLAQAADAGKAPAQAQAQKKLDELDEALVEGARVRPKRPGFKQYEQTFGWLARMVGRFVISGTVDLHAQGRSEDSRRVSGRAECVGFGAAPAVQCDLKVSWPDSTGPNGEEIPGGVTNLYPSAALFGLELVHSGVSYMLVDSRGIAETSVGEMLSADTMLSRSKCGAIAGDCQRVSRITASPDGQTIDMKIDLIIDQKTAVNFGFVMHRVAGVPSSVYGRKPEKGKK